MNLRTNIKSDLYKIFHTPIWLIHFVIPIAGVTLFLWYYSFSTWSETKKLSGYIQMLSVVFPILIGIITSVFAAMEQTAGDFYGMLATANAKYIPHISKLFLLIIFGFISSVFTLVGFGIGFIIMGDTTMNLLFYVKTAVLLIISVIPLYLVQYIISFRFGKEASIVLGIIGGLVSALLLTGLGDGIWYFVPWGIAARFSEYLLIAELSHTSFLQCNDVIKAIIFTSIFSLILNGILVLLFYNWEGRKSGD